MFIFHIYFFSILIPISLGNMLTLVDDYKQRDFTVLFNHLKKFFIQELRTVLYITDYDYKHLNDLTKELLIHTNGNTYIYNENFQNILNKNNNILLLNFNFEKPRLYFKNKILIYYDLRDLHCNMTIEYIEEKLNIIEFVTHFEFFNCVFLIQMPKDCGQPYQLWVREFWGNDWRQISEIKYAYFNRRPNLHQWWIRMDLVMNTSPNLGVMFKGKKNMFAEYVLKKWNVSKDIKEINNQFPFSFIPYLTFDEFSSMYNFFDNANSMQSYCVVIHKSDYHPSWQALPRSFDTSVWICLTISWFFSGIV